MPETTDRAKLAPGVERPAYHVALALDAADDVTEDEVREAADRTLRDMGLGGHRAFVVPYNSADHAHVRLIPLV